MVTKTRADKLTRAGYRLTHTQEFLGRSDDEMAIA